MATVAPPPPPATGAPAILAAADQQFIDRHITRTQRTLKLVDFSAWLLTVLIGLLAFILAAAVLDHWVVPGGLSTAGRAILFGTFMAAVAWYSLRALAPLLKPINPVFAAHTIESHSPSLKNSLLNLLWFRTQRQPMSTRVYQALEHQTAVRLSTAGDDGAVDRTALLRLGYVLLAAVAAIALYAALSPKNPLISAGRVLAPWADIAAPSRVRIQDVTPGDSQVARGERIEVSAEVLGAGADEPMRLHWSSLDRQVENERTSMARADGSARVKAHLPPGTGAGGVEQDLEYWIEAGDALSKHYKLTVYSRPTIVVQKVRYEPPPYTGYPTSEVDHTGDLRGIEGTHVTIQALANQQIKTAYVDFDADGTSDLKMQADGDRATASFTLALRDDRRTPLHPSYALRLTTAEGRANEDPATYSIDVTADYPPEVRITRPEEPETSARVADQVLIGVEARDVDFALSQVRLVGRVKDREVTLGNMLDKPQSGKFRGLKPFTPGDVQLKAGDVLEYWAEARDNREPKANVTLSDRRRMRIVADDDPNAPKGGQGGQGQPQVRQPGDGGAGDPSQPGEKQQNQQQGDKSGEKNSQQPGAKNDAGGEQGKNQQGGTSASGGSPDAKASPQDSAQQGQGQQGKGQPGENQQGGEGKQGEGQPGDQSQQGQPSPTGGQGDQSKPPAGGQSGGDQQSPAGAAPDQPRPGNGNGQGEGQGQKQDRVSPNGDDDGAAFKRIQDHFNEQAMKQGKESPGQESGDKSQKQQPGDAAQSDVSRDAKSAERSAAGQPPQGASDKSRPDQGQGNNPPQDGKTASKSGNSQPSGGQNSESGGAGSKSQPQEKSAAGKPGDSPQPDGAGKNQGQPSDDSREGRRGDDQAHEDKSGDGDHQEHQGDQATPNSAMNKNQGNAGTGQDTGQEQGAANGKPAKAREKSDKDKDNPQGLDDQTPPSAGQDKHEGDSRGGQGGDTTGGGQQGGGQHADAKGRGDAGQHEAADEGAGQATEQGEGETGTKAGDQKQADGKTGSDKKTVGKGGSGEQEPGAGSQESGDKGQESGDSGQKSADQKPGADDVSRDAKSAERSAEHPGDDQSSKEPGADPGKDSTSSQDGKQPGDSADGKQPGADGKQPGADGKQPGADGKQPGEDGKQSSSDASDGKSPGQPGSPSKGSEQNHAASPGGQSDGPSSQGSAGHRDFSSPIGPPQTSSEPEHADAANLDFAKKQTDLVLNRLDEELAKHKVDPELLRRLGWSEDELARFVDRWKGLKARAAGKGKDAEDAQNELVAALKSLGLKTAGPRRLDAKAADDKLRDLNEGYRTRAPLEYADQVRAYLKAAAE